MKHTRNLLKILFVKTLPLSLLLYSCQEIVVTESEPQNLYFKVYGEFYKETLNDMYVSPTNGHVKLIGKSKNSEDGDELFYIEVDENGIKHKYNTTKSDTSVSNVGHDIYNASTGDDYIAVSQFVKKDSFDIQIIKTPNAADIIFSDTVHIPLIAIQVNSVKILHDNAGSFLVATQYKDLENKDFICVYEVSESGKITPNLKHPLSHSVNAEEKSYCHYLSDGTIIFAAPVYENRDNTSKTNDILLFVAKDKNILWNLTYGNEESNEINADFFELHDTLYVAATITANGSKNKAGILKISKHNGAELSFTTLESSESLTLSSVLINNEGNFIFCGTTAPIDNSTNPKSNMFLQEISYSDNGELELVHETTFGYDDLNKGGIVRYSSANNCYFYSGILASNESEDIALFKLNMDGKWIE